MLPFDFDFTKPTYDTVYDWRLERIWRIRENPDVIGYLKEYYAENPWDFITHWGMTFDPRNAERGLDTRIPFLLFDKQEEWLRWVYDNWKNQRPGITEKTRDMGMSWLSVAFACTMCLFHDGFAVGFGSRKEEYVDKIGDPKSLFFKARMFMDMLPIEFRGGWNKAKHAPHMRIIFPESESTITGESGDGIGRGDRQSIYFVDESAFLERPALVDASLSATTNCRQDISTSKGMANPFAQKRHSGKFKVFTFNWRDDPRKAESNLAYKTELYGDKLISWYAKMEAELDPVSLAQEVDINYQASVEGIVIPYKWIECAVDAAKKLGIEITGKKFGALDVADEGIDLNSFCGRHGISVDFIKTWSGKESDIFKTTEKAFMICDELGIEEFDYDADGLGAGVKGDANQINARRKENKEKELLVYPFRGSGEVAKPDREMVKGRKNKDFFANFKAQSWWSLRFKFQNTFRAIEAIKNGVVDFQYDKDDIISLSPDLDKLKQLMMELSQPTYTINTAGKILIDKAPDGTRSPNMADSIMIAFAPAKRSVGWFS
jgi:phage terminase large subunit